VEVRPGKKCEADEEILESVKQIATTIFHPVGTCRIGKIGEMTTVVDQKFRVVGTQGLRVVDASVMPVLTSGNTNTPTAALAYLGAKYILENRVN
jgi:choline dehydrogenase